jgi:hypothetical protein
MKGDSKTEYILVHGKEANISILFEMEIPL